MTETTQLETQLRASAKRLVRHFASDFEALEAAYPGTYPRLIVRGEGAYLYDDTGNVVLDAGIHLGACQIGHGRPDIVDAVAAQMRTLEYVGLEAGISHPVAAELADELGPVVPVRDAVFAFCSSGSEANDFAFKIARAYHRARGEAGRYKVISRAGSYHGATYGGVSAAGHPAFREPFGPGVPGFVRATHPSPGRCGFCGFGDACTLRCADDVERVVLQEGPESVAAFIGEPVSIFQAVKVPHRDYWPRIREICDRYGILLIADEVVTGFGRTGTLFGSEHWRLEPDIVTMAKGLTSGYVPMGATVFSGVISELVTRPPLMHINTYAGHPGACAAALAALRILRAEQLVENAAELERVLRSALDGVAERMSRPTRTSATGLLGAVEFVLEEGEAEMTTPLRHELYERGVAARVGMGDGVGAVLFYPPLVVDESEVRRGVEAIGEALVALGIS